MTSKKKKSLKKQKSPKSPNNSDKEVQVVYQIGSTVNSGVELCPDFYLWKQKELDVLREFSKDLDIVRSCRDVGYTNPEAMARKLLKNEAIKTEMKAIYDARFEAMRLNEEMVAAKHLNLMKKFETDYDGCDADGRVKGQLANAVAKMSGDSLRAAGLFGRESKTTPNVVINLNLEGDKKEVVKETVIEGEAKDV